MAKRLPRFCACVATLYEEAVMAAARDQAARILRPEPDTAESGIARDTSQSPAEQAGADPSEQTVGRRPAEAPDQPAIDQPAAAPAADADAVSRAPKSGRRKLVLMGIVALLALAAAGCGGYYVLVGRF